MDKGEKEDSQNNLGLKHTFENPITPEKKVNWLKIILIIIGILIALGAGVYIGVNYFSQSKITVQQQQPQPTPSQIQVEPSQVISPQKITGTLVPDETAGWQEYKNVKYGYTIKHPQDAKISFALQDEFSFEVDEAGEPKDPELKAIADDKRFEYLYNKYGGEICVTITYKSASISISAAENQKNNHVICSPTGLGVDDKKISDEITIAGKKYSVTGYRNEVENNEWFSVNLDNGTMITYGSHIEGNATLKDYDLIKPDVKKIVETLKFS